MTLDPSYFSVADDSADRLFFEFAATRWRPVATSEIEETLAFGTSAFAPAKLRVALTAPGFEMYCPAGLRLHVHCASSPFLTWSEGSVTNGVPTPNVRWLVLSFATKEPPLIFGFPDRPCSMRIDGRTGDWTIGFPSLAGWVRVGPLFGTRSVAADTAFMLGKLAQSAAKQAEIYDTFPPKLMGVDLASDADSVTATWHFDRPGAVIPSAASLAKLGGYLLSVKSPAHMLDFESAEGVVEVADGTEITIRFPVRMVPAGRGLGIGPGPSEPLSAVSPTDVPGVVQLALENLAAARSHSCRIRGQEAYDAFFNQAEYSTEPWTGQQLPYAATGKGIDVCAAHALLDQALANTLQSSSEQNSLLTSIDWRRDWLTWDLCVDDPAVRRRAQALAALAGALCPEPSRRLDAAMLQAGLSAERGLELWRSHRDAAFKPAPLLEPELGLRQVLFGLAGPEDKDSAFMRQVLSPIRVYGDVALSATAESGRLRLSWPVVEAKPSMLSLASGFPVDLERGGNFSLFKVDQASGTTELRYTPEFSGDCWAFLTCPVPVGQLPPVAPAPAYSEPYR